MTCPKCDSELVTAPNALNEGKPSTFCPNAKCLWGPEPGTYLLCMHPGCRRVAEIIPPGEPVPAGPLNRKRPFCYEHRLPML